jgi:Pectate lyase superfamily protein
VTVTTTASTTGPMAGDGSNAAWPFSFSVQDASQLRVIWTHAGADTVLSSTDYSVALTNSGRSGGTVTYPLSSSRVAVGESITIRRSMAFTQTSNLRNQGTLAPETLESMADRSVYQDLQLLDATGRALRVPESETSLSLLPSATSRASKYLAFDSSGQPTAATLATGSVSVSSWAATLIDDSSAAAARTTIGVAGPINVKDPLYGAVGDGSTDDRAAIVAALTAAAAANKAVYFPPGTYRCSNGIELPKHAKLIGAGAPVLGTFPIATDAKEFLRPGYKHLLPGSTLLFTGTGAASGTTQRADRFASFTYCVKTTKQYPAQITGLAIVQDVDVYDSGGSLTTWSTHNSASYDVGLWLEDSTEGIFQDVTVFGYFAKAGLVVSSKETAGYEGDPDYNRFVNCRFMGDIGVALVGSESNDGFDSGLSGTQFYGCNIYDKTHHSRDNVTDDWGDNCLYIDGYTDAAAADINGHYFHGGCIRGYCNNTISLGYASNVYFSGTVFETSTRGTTNSLATQFLATANTRSVFFIGCRFSGGNGIYGASFSNPMPGRLVIVGGNNGEIALSETGRTVRLLTSGTGDPRIQWTTDPTSTTTGWQVLMDVSSSNVLDFRNGGTSRFQLDTGGGMLKGGFAHGGTKTIATGAIAIGSFNYYSVDTEAAAASDDLDTITGGGYDGQLLLLRAANSTRDVVLKDGTGNLRLTADFTLDHAQDKIFLVWDGTSWCEISRANNT